LVPLRVIVFGFQVLIDASQHALADKKTERERYVEIDFMNRDSLFKIPEFQQFYKKLEKCDLKEELWEIIGGSPMKVKNLVDECNGKEDIEEIVVEFLLGSLDTARQDLKKEVHRIPELTDLFSKLQTANSIDFSDFQNPDLDVKSVRVVEGEFVPSNPTIGFILRIGLEGVESTLKEAKKASVQQKVSLLKGMVSEAKKSVNEHENQKTEDNFEASSQNQK
jgi:hypothetical protein